MTPGTTGRSFRRCLPIALALIVAVALVLVWAASRIDPVGLAHFVLGDVSSAPRHVLDGSFTGSWRAQEPERARAAGLPELFEIEILVPHRIAEPGSLPNPFPLPEDGTLLAECSLRSDGRAAVPADLVYDVTFHLRSADFAWTLRLDASQLPWNIARHSSKDILFVNRTPSERT